MRKTLAPLLALSIAIAASSLGSVLVSLGLASSAAAQDAGDARSAAESRSTSFQAVEGSSREEIAGGGLLLGAYGTILVLLVGYVAWIAMLQQRTQRDLGRLRAEVQKAGSAAKRD